VEGLRDVVARHITWARELAGQVEAAPDFELLALKRRSGVLVTTCRRGQRVSGEHCQC
jgi:glutamate/tyrosine decarboxylase-like PLP-dependent enzyme